MKFQAVSSIVAAGAIALTATPSFSQTVTAVSPNFACQTQNGIPTTVTLSAEGNRPMLHWLAKYFPGGNSQQLCQDSVAKFQNNQDTLKYLATGDVNGKPLVCFVESRRNCNAKDPVLFTLKPTDNPKEVLYDLLDSSVKKPPTEIRGEHPTYGPRRMFFFF